MHRHCFRVDEIPRQGLEVVLDLADPEWTAALDGIAEHRPGAAGSARARVHRRHHRVEVHGRFDVTLTLECSRCLEPVPTRLAEDFRSNLVLELDPPKGTGPVDAPGAPLDDSLLVGDTIDLLELLREQVLLELPPKPLCSPDCPGICVGCGSRLAAEPCRCPAASAAPDPAGGTASQP